MAERFFLIPMRRGTGQRQNTRGPDGVWADSGEPEVDGGRRRRCVDTPGSDDLALLHCREINPARATTLGNRPRVVPFPANFANVLGSARVNTINTRVGTQLGTDFDVDGMTAQEAILDILARIMQWQRFWGVHGRTPTPAEIGNEMTKAAADAIALDWWAGR